MSNNKETISTRIWKEIPEPDNPFAAKQCFCHGYDVYGEVINKASWVDYLYLLFAGERPTPEQSNLLERLAIVLANPGPRDHSVRAAMNAGVGGSTHASCLMAALAVGAGQLNGAQEIVNVIELWSACSTDLSLWQQKLTNPETPERADIWLPLEHPPGFDPNGVSCATPVRQGLDALAQASTGKALLWLKQNRQQLETYAGHPLAMSGVAAAAFFDLELDAEQSEMLYLLLRLPGAAVHALEQEKLGWRKYPFFNDAIELLDDPGPKANRQSDTNKQKEEEMPI